MEDFPIQAAYAARTNLSDKIGLSYEVLRSTEDLLLACLNNYEDQQRGYSILKSCKEIREGFCISESDLYKDKMIPEENVRLNKVVELGNGIKGCSSLTDTKRPMRTILGDSNYSVGDIQLKAIANTKKYQNLFALLNIQSITDQKSLGMKMFGISHATCQLSGGASFLGAHVEHHNCASLNLLHCGDIKEWYIIPSSKYISAIQRMESVQPNTSQYNQIGDQSTLFGVCDSSLTHRDLYIPPDLLECGGSVVYQEPGDIVIVHPSAIHSIRNHGMNLAESRNYLPLEFKNYVASYKTCEHSERLGGKPLQEQMDDLIKDLPLKDFIHESDKNKNYKIRLLDHLEKEGKQRKYKEAVRMIKQSHDIPEWFEDELPLDEEENVKEKGPAKKFTCICKYTTNYYQDLTKHMKRKHKRIKPPPNTNREECLDCGNILKDLSMHVCSKRRRVED